MNSLLFLNKYAIFVMCATFILIFAGGLVTSTGSGLSVPDWPLSFGQLFPKMEGGIFFEHGHRMIAGTVVVLTMILSVLLWKFESKIWVKYIGLFAIISVLLQAVLGGITVLLKLPLWVSVSHAGLAQLFFCFIVTIAVATDPGWHLLNAKISKTIENGQTLQRISKKLSITIYLSIITTITIYLQILIGAIMRHMGAGMAIPDFPLNFGQVIPPGDSWTPSVIIHFAHRIGAFIVAVMLVSATVQILRFCKNGLTEINPLTTLNLTEDNLFIKRFYVKLRHIAIFTHILLFIQISLGAFTIWTGKSVLIVTSHVATGALLLASMLVLTLRLCRFAFVLSHTITGSYAKTTPDIETLYEIKALNLEKTLR